MFKLKYLAILIFVAFSLSLVVQPFDVYARPLAATSPPLGAAESYSILAGSEVTSTGITFVEGNLGIYPGIGPFPHYTDGGTLTVGPPGTIQDGTPGAASARDDFWDVFVGTGSDGIDQPCTTTYPGAFKDLVGLSLGPGVYCATQFRLSGTLTLVGSGVWIFKSASDLIITGTANVVVVGGDPCNVNVWWRVVSSASFDPGTSLIGNILASTSITMAAGATLIGRALAHTGNVTLIANTITTPVCVLPISKAFNPSTIVQDSNSTLTITFTNPNAFATTTPAAFTDYLPVGIEIAATPNATTTCGVAVVPITGGSYVTLPAGAIIPGGSILDPGTCTLTVNVTGTGVGSLVNTIPANIWHTFATATLIVTPRPVVTPTVVPGVVPTVGPGVVPTVGPSGHPVVRPPRDCRPRALHQALKQSCPNNRLIRLMLVWETCGWKSRAWVRRCLSWAYRCRQMAGMCPGFRVRPAGFKGPPSRPGQETRC